MRHHSKLASVALIVAALATPMHAQTAEHPTRQITVTGEGRVEAAPDMATMTLGVTIEGRTAAAAMSANSAQLTQVLDRLRAAGVADRDLQTTGLSLNPNWQQPSEGGTPRITGYVASNMLTVRLRDLAAMGGVLDAAIGDGANTFNGLSFGLSEPGPAMDEARRQAVADALARARLLTEAAGVTLGPVLSITEGGGYSAPGPMYRMEAASDAAVPVVGGAVATQTSVTMVFGLIE